MAVHFIDENAVGTNDGTSWTNAFRDSTTANDSASTLAGDTYWYASDHDYAYADLGNITLVFPDDCTLLSIDKTTDEFLVGAKETVGFSDDLEITVESDGGSLKIYGISFLADDNIIIGVTGSLIIFNSSILTLTGLVNSDTINTSFGDGCTLILENTDIVFTTTGQALKCISGVKVVLNNCTVNSVCNSLFNTGGIGGSDITVENSDLSSMTSGVLVNSILSSDDINIITFTRVKKNSGVEIYSGSILSKGSTIDAWSIDNGDGYHYFEAHRYWGKVKESTYNYRVSGATYDGSNGFSAEYLPNTNVIEYTQPLRYELGNYEIDLSSGADLTFHLLITGETAQHVALTNSECWIEVVHPDATDLALGVTVSSIAVTITTIPVTLTASTVSWANEGTYIRKHQITVTIPTVPLTTAAVSASLCMARILDDANEMFVCPDPEVI